MTEADLQLVFDQSGIKELIASIAKLDASMAALIAEANKAEGGIKEVGEAAKKTASEAEFMGVKMSKIKEAMGALGLGLGIREVFNLGKAAIASAVNYETLSVQFEVFLGSAEKAEKTLASLNKFSIETPFTPEEVNASARSLLAFGVTSEDLIPTLKLVGDVSSATGKDFGELSVLFGKAKIAGELMKEDLNQFTEAGIPLLDELAKMYGVTAGEVGKMASDHMVSFDDMKTAFANMTGEGGRFNGMMDKMSQSTEGLLSTIEGKLQDELRAIGQAMLPTVRIIAEGFEPAFKALKEAFIQIYTPMADTFSAFGDLFNVLSVGGKEGNKFANIVTKLAEVMKFLTIPAQLVWKWISAMVKAFTYVVGGISEFIRSSPALIAVVDGIAEAFSMAINPIGYVADLLGYNTEEVDATTAAYNGLLRELGGVAAKMGATAEMTKDFADSINVAKYATMSKGEAIKAIQADFAAYIETFKDGEKVIPKVAKAITDVKNAAGPAAGSIAYLEAEMKKLQEAFKQTTSQADRNMLAFKIKQIGDEIEKMSGKTQPANAALSGLAAKLGSVAKAAGQAKSDMAAVMAESAAAGQPIFGNEIDAADVLNSKLENIGKTIKGQLKSAMYDFAAASTEAIGAAIGAGESVGSAFKKVISEMLKTVPKLAGMALIQAAASADPSMPLAVRLGLLGGGLALVGLSGLIGGIQAKNAKEREDAANMGGLAGPSGGAGGRSAMPTGLGESLGGTIDITLNIDGQRLAQLQYDAMKKETLKRR